VQNTFQMSYHVEVPQTP